MSSRRSRVEQPPEIELDAAILLSALLRAVVGYGL